MSVESMPSAPVSSEKCIDISIPSSNGNQADSSNLAVAGSDSKTFGQPKDAIDSPASSTVDAALPCAQHELGGTKLLPDLDEALHTRLEDVRKRVLADLNVGTAAAGGSSSSNGGNEGSSFRKSKRNKLLLPEERKAYFAILSLLVDRGLIPPESKGQPLADVEAAEACVPEGFRPLLNLLKDLLRFDCE